MSPLEPQPVGIPVPNPSVRSREYWDACRRGVLTYQQCSGCGFIGLRSFTVCARCLSHESRRKVSDGRGSLYSWTVVWRAPGPAFVVPYAPAVVELDEGFYMVSAVIGCETTDLTAGMRLEVEFHQVSEEIALPYFAPLMEG
ncbi:MAG: OB-fold domain-containing protein [Acidimicrobiales bacterium]